MSLEELHQHQLPSYSKDEELFNTTSHIIGASCGFVILILGTIFAIISKRNILELSSIMIYGFSAILLYSVSSTYHGLKKERFSKKILQIIDHCTIFILICGTYTPICILSLLDLTIGKTMLIMQWILAIFGIIINAYALNKRIVCVISMILYIVMGWMIIFFPSAIHVLPFPSFLFILLGGIIYTIGSILYGIGAKKRWFHCIFHIFCVLATIFQAIGVLLLI